MAAKRKALSKRLRFEVFKRDGFRCVYCGTDPVQSVLHVDHVVAVANGGTSAPENLVTSCRDCNGGKSSVPLEQRRLPVGMSAEALTEHLEQLRGHLALQRAISETKRQAVDLLAARWEDSIGAMSNDMYSRLATLMGTWPTERLLEAMEITARKMGAPSLPFSSYHATQQAKYFHGILRQWRAGSGA